MRNKDTELKKLVSEARREAKNKLKGFVNENQVGYEGCLIREMKEILKEKGIDWEPDYGERSID